MQCWLPAGPGVQAAEKLSINNDCIWDFFGTLNTEKSNPTLWVHLNMPPQHCCRKHYKHLYFLNMNGCQLLTNNSWHQSNLSSSLISLGKLPIIHFGSCVKRTVAVRVQVCICCWCNTNLMHLKFTFYLKLENELDGKGG